MHVLFYDDSPVFGGHEVMTLAGLEALLALPGARATFFAAEAGGKLLEELRARAARHPNLEVVPLDFHSSKLEALRNRLRPSRAARLAERLAAAKPDLVLAVQGNIEHSSLALHAARRAGLRCASYIPVPHLHREMGAKLGAARDLACRHLFGLPDAFVTISDEMAAMLRRRGAGQAIHVVYNGVDTSRFVPRDRAECRAALGLPSAALLLGVIGRVEFRQKQQQLLVEAVASRPALAADCHLVFAGEGPDREALRAWCERRHPAATLLPWSDPAGLYPALDALVIPSRYEGLPLVMLEALACGTSVLGSDRDGMKDLLPAERRFRPDDVAALADAIESFAGAGRPAAEPAVVERVRTTMSLEAFGQAFAGTLRQLATPG